MRNNAVDLSAYKFWVPHPRRVLVFADRVGNLEPKTTGSSGTEHLVPLRFSPSKNQQLFLSNL
jgi:hypothetical protein